ncbi:PadR family transcriptional regulator [candidate division KSB1 bacterium]
MRILARAEELVLLAVYRLNKDAYSVPIRAHLSQITGNDWSFGAIYVPLDRLEKKGYLMSILTDPTAERGGRSKRVYKLTNEGSKALLEIKKVEKAIWEGISETSLENQ